MQFQINKTAIWQAMKWEKVFKWARILKILCLVLFVILVCWCLFSYFGLGKSFDSLKNSTALAITFLCLAVIFGESKMFFEKKLKNPALKYTLKQALQN
ncbi:MAG: hypothetical protein PHW31_04390, partial [Candidatus Pacebacteria bacterium]|nr:hypothetical protein [Candidatus Paceibacterota bacterium]